jgi:secreted Zn-dependent insulinase-like peptidase
MSLVISGKESLEELQQYAEDHFADVKNQDCQIKDYSQEILFDSTRLNQLFRVQPLDDKTNQLVIKWPKLPDQRPNWRTKSLEYIIDTLNDDGDQSLGAVLVKNDLATSLNALKISRLHNMKSGLQITVNLTENGV